MLRGKLRTRSDVRGFTTTLLYFFLMMAVLTPRPVQDCEPASLTLTSPQLTAIAEHAETVYFIDGATLRRRTQLDRILSQPTLVLESAFAHLKDEVQAERLKYLLIGAKEFR